MRPLRIGCIPYLNVKPLSAWFDSGACTASVELVYGVPSQLARALRAGTVDVGIVSIFEVFRNPGLLVVPGVSIAADGPVKSVRLFSRVPFGCIRTVALDTSSLTSAHLIRILLRERYGITPVFEDHAPNLDAMLARYDAGLIIGDLKLFRSPAEHILDLGAEWKALTGLPFVYAAWLAREEAAGPAMVGLLQQARDWGCARLEALSEEWAGKMDLPLDQVRDYFLNVMRYDLDARKRRAIEEFRARCGQHRLVEPLCPVRYIGEAAA